MPDTTDGRVLRGERSRSSVVDRACGLAAVVGLDGLSLAGLAHELRMSKSGVAALFGSKEALQLATVARARAVFVDEVVAPALAVPGGLDRVRALAEAHLGYSRRRLESGGCFFAATSSEFAARPGAVRDAVVAARREWEQTVTRVVTRAVDKGDLRAGTDPVQVSYEIRAVLEAANTEALRTGSQESYDRAAVALDTVLGARLAALPLRQG